MRLPGCVVCECISGMRPHRRECGHARQPGAQATAPLPLPASRAAPIFFLFVLGAASSACHEVSALTTASVGKLRIRTQPAADGCPPGLRLARLPTKGVDAAREELEKHFGPRRRTLEMQYSFSHSRHGQLRRHRGPDSFPECYALMKAAEQAFGLVDRDVDRVQVMVRKYNPSQRLKIHIDSVELFEEPVLSVILRCDGAGDGLVLRPLGRAPAADAFQVHEQPGVAVCLEGDARYTYGHEVPPVTAPRISFTWRWFQPESLSKLRAK